MEITTLVLLNFIIGLGLVYLLRRQDRYHPESLWHMSLATIVGGVISVSLTLLFILGLHQIGLYKTPGYLDFFLYTGPIEETSKLIGFLLFVKLFKINLDEPVDAVIYMSCAALSFSLIENLGYAMGTPVLIGIRSVTATPMHIIFSSTMALVYSAGAGHKKFYLNLTKSVLIASFFHGLYDSLVWSGILTTTHLYLLITFSLLWGKKIFGYTLLNSPHRVTFENLKALTTLRTKNCIACAKEGNHSTYKIRNLEFDECQSCLQVVLPEKRARKVIDHFLPHHFVFLNKNEDLQKRFNSVFREFHDKNYDMHRKFSIKDAGMEVSSLTEEFKKVFERSATFSFVFGTRPMLSSKNGILNYEFRSAVTNDGTKMVFVLLTTFLGVFLFIWALMAVLRNFQ